MSFDPTTIIGLIQQKNDALNAISQQNANTSALVGAAGARLDTTRATLLPAESAANIAEQGARTQFINTQDKLFPVTARAAAAASYGQAAAGSGAGFQAHATGNSIIQDMTRDNAPLSPSRVSSLIGSPLGLAPPVYTPGDIIPRGAYGR